MGVKLSGLVDSLLFCTVVLGGVPGDSLNLKYKFDAAVPLKYEVSGNTLRSTKIGEYPAQELQTFAKLVFSVNLDTPQTDNFFHLDMRFKKINVVTRVREVTNYSNTDVLVGKSITAVIDQKGKVKEVVGFNLLPRVQLAPTDQTGENFGKILKGFFVEFPERPVGVGDQWQLTTVDTTKEAGKTTIVETKVEYKLKKIVKKKGALFAQVSGKLEFNVVQKGSAMGGEFSFNGEGDGKIEHLFNIEKGVIVSKKMSTSLDGIIKLSGGYNQDGTISETSEANFKLVQ